ncbi:hypothetical protein MXB_1118 [Myxobolus squamalis]|nr:hypothetical protein MXB_1118 [Myxobolus squamalis]
MQELHLSIKLGYSADCSRFKKVWIICGQSIVSWLLISWFWNKYKKILERMQSEFVLNFDEEKFWATVYGLLYCGRFEHAASVLHIHPHYSDTQPNNIFHVIEAILIDWPDFSNDLNLDLDEWRTRFELFQTQIRDLKSKNTTVDSNILNLLNVFQIFFHLSQILLGIPSEYASDIIEYHFEKAALECIFSQPLISFHDFSLKLHTRKFYSAVDLIYHSFIERDYDKFFKLFEYEHFS